MMKTINIIKALASLVGRLSLSVGCENTLNGDLRLFRSRSAGLIWV